MGRRGSDAPDRPIARDINRAPHLPSPPIALVVVDHPAPHRLLPEHPFPKTFWSVSIANTWARRSVESVMSMVFAFSVARSLEFLPGLVMVRSRQRFLPFRPFRSFRSPVGGVLRVELISLRDLLALDVT